MLTKRELLEILRTNGLDRNKTVRNSLKIAQQIHQDQTRDNGDSYLEAHVYPVTASVLNRYGNDKRIIDLVSAALLHDVLENSDIQKEFLEQKVGEDIADIVGTLTKSKEEIAHGKTQDIKHEMNRRYIKRMSNGEEEPIIIKLEDRVQNLQSTPEEVIKRRRDKYERYTSESEELFLPLTKKVKHGTIYKKLIEKELKRFKSILSIS